jgi:hypothetical protein
MAGICVSPFVFLQLLGFIVLLDTLHHAGIAPRLAMCLIRPGTKTPNRFNSAADTLLPAQPGTLCSTRLESGGLYAQGHRLIIQ